jgi:Ca2+-binding RTX toxin-like protein
MATFVCNPNKAFSFAAFDVTGLDGDVVYELSPTVWRAGPFSIDLGTNVELQGTGFTYSNGALTAGTITSITTHVGGPVGFQITGMSMPVATYNAYKSAGNQDDAYPFLEDVFSGSDTITGSNFADLLRGFAGNDTIDGKNSDDFLDGGAGSDTLIGGEGNDHYVLDSTGDKIVETGAGSGDRADANFSVDLNSVAFDGIENVLLWGTGNLSATGDGVANYLQGNDGANKISGNAGDDTIFGWQGNDTLDGGTGNDYLNGGEGNDTYYVDSASDIINEAFGTDSVFSSAESFTLSMGVENLTLTGSAYSGTGNSFNNVLTGTSGANYLDGKAGADTMIGAAGDDWYAVDNSQDKVTETSTGGSDTVVSSVSFTLPSYVEFLYLLNGAVNGTGNASANSIYGNGAANKIDGAAGNDKLFGGAGDDNLVGGAGNDSLYGGGGANTLDASAGNDIALYGGGLDMIFGFDGNATGGQDKLSLDAYFDELGVAGTDRAERLHLSRNGGTVDVWLDHDGDGSTDFQIAAIHTVDVIGINEDILLT